MADRLKWKTQIYAPLAQVFSVVGLVPPPLGRDPQSFFSSDPDTTWCALTGLTGMTVVMKKSFNELTGEEATLLDVGIDNRDGVEQLFEVWKEKVRNASSIPPAIFTRYMSNLFELPDDHRDLAYANALGTDLGDFLQHEAELGRLIAIREAIKDLDNVRSSVDDLSVGQGHTLGDELCTKFRCIDSGITSEMRVTTVLGRLCAAYDVSERKVFEGLG